MTAGGPIEVMRLPETIEIAVLTGDREEGPVLADAIVMEVKRSALDVVLDRTLAATG